MDIKTRFSVDDTVYFLTTTDRILHFGDNQENKPYVCEGVVTSIDIEFRHEKLVITYTVKVRSGVYNDGRIDYEWMAVDEDWLASDLIQLGQNVSNGFRMVALNPKKAKKKK